MVGVLLRILVASILVIAADFAWSWFYKMSVYRLLREPLSRLSNKTIRLFFR
jgi:hypothetical protein